MRTVKEYPKMLYASGGISPMIVNDQEEEAKARLKGMGDYVCVLGVPVTPLERKVLSGSAEAPGIALPTDTEWNDVKSLMAYGRSIGMTLGPKYGLETLRSKVTEFFNAKARP